MDLVKSALTADAEMITRGYLALARLYQARGELTQALATLDAFAQLAAQRGFAPQLLTQEAAVRAQVELAQGKLEAATRWAEASGLSARDVLSYIHEREYLTLVRVLIAEAQEHPTNHGHGGSRPLLSQALILLERLLEDAEPKARMSSVIEILILRALALHALGDSTGALTALGRALALAEPQGYICLFLEEGAPMTVLLRQAYTQKITPEYTVALLEASGEHGTMIPQLHTTQHSLLIEPLTRRERAVPGLLIDGASNREIAERLVLSVNTVKKHVFNICSKLNVQSRAQVVARARTLNLL